MDEVEELRSQISWMEEDLQGLKERLQELLKRNSYTTFEEDESKRALEWWDNLSNIECKGFEREYSLYVNDQVTGEDILFIFRQEKKLKQKI